MKKYVHGGIGFLIAGLLLWVLFRRTDWGEVLAAIQGASLGWIIAAHVPMLIMFPTRIKRWTYIVRATQPVSFRDMFSATQIGFLVNFTLPGRVGEAIRALVLTRLTGIKFSKSFALVALDRVTDLFGLITIMFVAVVAYQPVADVIIPAATFGTPSDIVFTAAQYRAGAIFTCVFLAAIVATFVLLYMNRDVVLRLSNGIIGIVSKKAAGFISGMLNQFADGLHVFRSPSDMGKSISFSLLTWGLTIPMLICMMKAFHIEFAWYTPFVMQSLLAVAISAPGAPGFVGQFHVPLVLTLVMLVPDISLNDAKAFAIVTHLIQLPPVFILGIYFLAKDRLGLFELSSAGEKMSHAQPGDTDT